MMKFGYTIFYVSDVEKAIAFYEKAFGLKQKFIAPGNEYGELETGSTTLSFAAVSLAESNLESGFVASSAKSKPFGIEIGFVTDKVEEAFTKAVRAGAIALEKPKTKPWGQVVAYVKDLNGFIVEICSPMG